MYPREAPKKPLAINAGARNKVVLGVMSGFTLFGAALVYILDLVSISIEIALKPRLKVEFDSRFKYQEETVIDYLSVLLSVVDLYGLTCNCHVIFN